MTYTPPPCRPRLFPRVVFWTGTTLAAALLLALGMAAAWVADALLH